MHDTSLPSVAQYKEALLAAATRDNNQPLLKAHYYAVGRTAKPTELAEQVGFPDGNAVNVQYGNLAGRVCSHLGRSEFSPNVRILAAIDSDGCWIMHPQVAQALEELGWV